MEGRRRKRTNKSSDPLKDIQQLSSVFASASSSPLASYASTPRALLRKLVKFPRQFMKKEEKKKRWEDTSEVEWKEAGEEEQVSVVVVEIPLIPKTTENTTAEEEKEELSVPSGRKPDSAAFNIGIGAGLFFLVSKSAAEFNKMIELQRQLEVLLKDIKGEMQRKNAISSCFQSKNQTVLTVSNCCEEESSSNPMSLQNNDASYHILGRQNGFESDSRSKCETSLDKKRGVKINQLEEELEVELQRLQIKMDIEDSSAHPQQYMKELDNETNPSESLSTNIEEIGNKPEQEINQENCGVCPRELERRLHELLESRQQERIAELESAMECAERRLHEKENEICWWRDTARLVSKNKEVDLEEANMLEVSQMKNREKKHRKLAFYLTNPLGVECVMDEA